MSISRTFGSALLATTAVFASSGPAGAVKAPVQASRITFRAPVRACGHVLTGTYIVVHDETKMARGEPCTTFYRLHPNAAAEVALSFHCIPRQRPLASETTIVTAPSIRTTAATPIVELLEYQIAGDSEAHGLPPFDVHLTAR
jgi:hypothetical protein